MSANGRRHRRLAADVQAASRASDRLKSLMLSRTLSPRSSPAGYLRFGSRLLHSGRHASAAIRAPRPRHHAGRCAAGSKRIVHRRDIRASPSSSLPSYRAAPARPDLPRSIDPRPTRRSGYRDNNNPRRQPYALAAASHSVRPCGWRVRYQAAPAPAAPASRQRPGAHFAGREADPPWRAPRPWPFRQDHVRQSAAACRR